MAISKHLCSFAITAVGLATSASAFTSEDGSKVEPLSNGDVRVFEERFFGVRGLWCGAADYAFRVKKARGPERIYLKEPQTRGTNSSAVFTMDSSGLTPVRPQNISDYGKTPGANFSVQRAFQFCIQLRAPYRLFG